MIDWDLLRHVWDGAKLLALGDDTLKRRLIDAAHEFSVALVQPDHWPEDLLQRAQELDSELTANGDYRSTIEAMPEAATRDIAERLFDLAIDVEVAVRLDMRKST